MPITKGIKQLLAEANAAVETMTAKDAVANLADAKILFVDLRDPRELQREGKIPNAFHCPRGMLEFWLDPESPYHKPVFAEGRKFLFYCASGWRSALAAKTAREMGLDNVAHIGGGFTAWKEAGGAVEAVEKRG